MPQSRRYSIIKYKLFYSAIVLFVYIIGRCIPLYGIDIGAYTDRAVDAEGLLMQTIGGDAYRYSIFALGISPYMISNLFVQLIALCKSDDAKTRTSPKKMNRATLAVTFTIAMLQATVRVQDLHYRISGDMLILARITSMAELLAGAMVILWLADRNKLYGIGGQTLLIFVNILDSTRSMLHGHGISGLAIPLLLSAAVMVVIVIMENAEKRIPVQRISIHNIYADKNYLAVKLNPIGIMPVMFSTALFMLPQLIVSLLGLLFPEDSGIAWWQENMSLSRPLGIAMYLVCLYVLTIGLSMIFLSPKDMTEQFLKSGDSIVDLHAGRDTRRYLRRVMWGVSFFSATVMGLCLGMPLFLQMGGGIDGRLAMLPSSVMMLTGIWCNLYREAASLRKYDAYRPFI